MTGTSKEWKFSGDETLPMPPMDLPPLVWQVLYNRGLRAPQDIDEVIRPSLSELKDPFSLDSMERAVDRLLLAKVNNEQICIYADFDLDGTSGCALLLAGLEQLGFSNVSYYQPRRLSEGYGLHLQAIDEIVQRGVQLLVTVDVGITAVPAVEHARSVGLDVIVTDHHLPKDCLPPAYAVINPNSGKCHSGLGHLSGVGVAFYLFLALAKKLRSLSQLNLNSYRPKDLLDCFAIGTLTDLVPLKAENRVLIKHGLIALAQTKRPGLSELLKALNLYGRPLTSADVAMRFAPKLNALSRLELGILPIELFLERDLQRARELVGGVINFNQMRMELQKKAEAQVMAHVGTSPSSVILDYCPSYHRGVVGLVATKIAQTYGVPAFIGSLEEDGKIVGSARVPPGSNINLTKMLEAAADDLNHFGGHAAAAGFALDLESANRFEQRLIEFSLNGGLVCQGYVEELSYDAVVGLSQIDDDLMDWHERLEPFGTGFDSPKYRLLGLEVLATRELRGGHLKLSLSNGLREIEGLWFSPDPEKREGLIACGNGSQIELIGEPQWNYFRNRRTLQVVVHDLRLVSSVSRS